MKQILIFRLLNQGIFLFSLLIFGQIMPSFAIDNSQINHLEINQVYTDSLLQQGKTYYQEGKLDQAIKTWSEGVKFYQEQNESINQIQSLNYLALAYQDLGQYQEAQRMIENSINVLNNFPQLDTVKGLLLAQALNTQGMIQLLQGQTETALLTWQESTKIYQNYGDDTGKLMSQLNQAQALQNLGRYRQAKDILESLVKDLKQQPDSILKAQGLKSLGVALQSSGDLIQSKEILDQSWHISQDLNSPADISDALFSLANVAQDLQQYDVAWLYYEEALKLENNPLSQLEIQLNQLNLLIKFNYEQTALDLIPEIATNLQQLPPSRHKIYASINLAESLNKLIQNKQNINQNTQITFNILTNAIQEAQQLKDNRAEAFAFYQLGKLYQITGNNLEAQKITKTSLNLAQTINANDITAHSASQLALIFKQEGNLKEAIANYEIAFQKIQSLRQDLVAINPDLQFNFKENIEPIYRDYVNVLLSNNNQSQEQIKRAREVMEALQLAELDNYFRSACLDTYPVKLEEIDPQATIIYPIILPDRLEVIVSIPHQPLTHFSTSINQTEITETLKEFHSSFSPGYPRHLHYQLAQKVYNWLLKPVENQLQNSNIKTLVFIPDGFFRNLPMSALYDGKQYLIEKYSIALSPGLQLFAQGLSKEKLSIFAGGLTEARQGFNPLPSVSQEIEQIKTDATEIKPQILINQEFTLNNVQNILNNQNFPIIHLATHGQFSSDPNETFLLTWDHRISITEFDRLFEKRRLGLLKPIELLVLSACQTAQGDNRATLGLAGFALRSGARSTIGSLWAVSDDSTSQLMMEFYDQLFNHHLSKAEALRQAQLNLLHNPLYQHPYFWSSFILVGNWL